MSTWDIIIDLVGPEDKWPRYIIRDLYRVNGNFETIPLNYSGRYTFVCFLLQNGVSPTLILNWFTENGYTGRDLNHVNGLLRDFKEGRVWSTDPRTGSRRFKFKQFNVHEGRTTEFGPAPLSRNPRHNR